MKSRIIAWLCVAALPAWAGSASVAIPQGEYVPQYGADGTPIAVAAFALDVHAVTNADFLEFLREQPNWQRDHVAELFADAGYLSHWAANMNPGELAPPLAPVTNVSWFAARAYCASVGKRLPTMDEWERAAAAGIDTIVPADRSAFNQRILEWYSRPTRFPLPNVEQTFRNYWGVWDLHGLVWEWVEDFNSLMTTGGSRKDAGGLDRQLFCAAGSVGSVDPADYAAFMRYAMRGSVKARHAVQNLGFPCARDIAPPVGDSR